ncbi:Aste57867_24425 [Aphanomyces stellatus]|uniref:Aste57867_24425 protein n=1 Tax=Aphanomyces stellatus TaxID=120398 RepID=A0A485LRZ7_9STRA|nr:hypothetical protein As57867_024349 [Aphanomyces stellatus]VFU01065.1 Aste57867_24425 [Aphanomyces stellatus]
MMPQALLPLTKSPPKAKMAPPRMDSSGPPPGAPSSPRKAKLMLKSTELRSLEFTTKDHVTILPGNVAENQSNGTGTMQDILLFDQKLRDAAPHSQLRHAKLNVDDWRVSSPTSTDSLLASNKLTFEILTSDRGQRVVTALVKQWDADKYSDNGRSLWAIVETFFTSLPYVFVRDDQVHSKLILRYVAALASLKDVIVQGLFCSNASAAMAITATLTPTHHEKIPLYWHCHQLEREVQSLKNSTSDQSWEMVHSSDIGLLQQDTAHVLLTFWKLPKRERLAFLAQVFSNVSEIETDLIRVLLDNSTFILQRALEELGYESRPKQPKMAAVGNVVRMSLAASNQAKQLHKWRDRVRNQTTADGPLEPIQVRHKGIQVNVGGGGMDADDLLGGLMDAIAPRTPSGVGGRNRRTSAATGDKSTKYMLAPDYQNTFGKNKLEFGATPHLLMKDMWTVANYTEHLVHDLVVFIESAQEAKNVPVEVIMLSTLLLEWLRYEKSKAVSNAKDTSMEVLDSPHFRQCIVSLMQLLRGQPESRVPDVIKSLATRLQEFVQDRQGDTTDAVLFAPTPSRVVAQTASPPKATTADVRSFLRNGFPAEIVNQIVSISNEESDREKESKMLLLTELLEHHTMDRLHRGKLTTTTTTTTTTTKGGSVEPAGFGHGPPAPPKPAPMDASSVILKTLVDQMKAVLIDGSNGKVNDEKAAALLLEFVNSRKPSLVGDERTRMLSVETLCSVLEKKVDLQLHAGPLDKATRKHMAQLQKYINKLLPESIGVVDDGGGGDGGDKASPPTKPNNIVELVQRLEQTLAKKDVIDPATANVLESLHAVLLKTQAKMNGQPVESCVNTLVESLQASGDEILEDFCSGIDEMAMNLKAILASCVEADEMLNLHVLVGSTNDPSASDGATTIDDVINDSRIDAIPLFIINISKKLKAVGDAATVLSQQKKPRNSMKGDHAVTTNTSHHHASLKDEVVRVRKGAGTGGVLFASSLWETNKTKKPNVLGISVTELSEMFVENKTVLNPGTVQKLIYQIYRERYECNLTEQDNPNTTAFIDFVYDWYLRKYGLRKLAMQHLSKLMLSLKKQKKKSKKALLFCRFLGLFPPLFDYSALNFALGLLNVWTNGTFAVTTSTNRVPLSTLSTTLEDSFDRRFGPFCSTALVKERMARNACSDDVASIDQDVALEVALEEYAKMKQGVETMLADIYLAGDMNGDDKMGFDEFATVVRNLAPCVSDREIVKMFKEALLDPTFDTITKQRFVNVIIDQGVLSSRVNKFKAPSGTSNTTAFPEYEEEQFGLLEETWRAHESEIVKAIEAIPHKETMASMLLRVKILNMIIAKKIDSETAWLSHRMILRDVDRFREMNESEIVEIKKKEAYFKEAVSRITSSKFGLFQDAPKGPPRISTMPLEIAPPTAAAVTTTAPGVVVDFVQNMAEKAVDETALKGEKDDDDNQPDMDRIEDSLRTEMLNLAEGGTADDGVSLERQLDKYDDAVKKVRRMSMTKQTNAITKLTAVVRMSKIMARKTSLPTVASVATDLEDDNEDDDGD